MKSQNKVVQQIEDLDLVKNAKKEISKLSDQFVDSYDKLSCKKRSVMGIGWLLGAGIVLGAIYFINGERNIKKSNPPDDKKAA